MAALTLGRLLRMATVLGQSSSAEGWRASYHFR
ncbi:Uncharacterised protein [Bordetella pertussis]|nr:Uncharacterised protein [Bordetella pertussis]CPN95673.1 Uncharacterised protein [Bordetella pertussis]